jgi:hypothetical protein
MHTPCPSSTHKCKVHTVHFFSFSFCSLTASPSSCVAPRCIALALAILCHPLSCVTFVVSPSPHHHCCIALLHHPLSRVAMACCPLSHIAMSCCPSCCPSSHVAPLPHMCRPRPCHVTQAVRLLTGLRSAVEMEGWGGWGGSVVEYIIL